MSIDKKLYELKIDILKSEIPLNLKNKLANKIHEIEIITNIPVINSLLVVEDFHIGFEYLQYEMDSERYLNKGMIWVKKQYGFNSPRLHKIKELIDKGGIKKIQ